MSDAIAKLAREFSKGRIITQKEVEVLLETSRDIFPGVWFCVITNPG